MVESASRDAVAGSMWSVLGTECKGFHLEAGKKIRLVGADSLLVSSGNGG